MIAVFGGTGRLGRPLVARLVADGYAVRVVSRSPALARGIDPRVDLVRGDVRDPSSLGAALAGATAVVSAVTGFGGRDAAGTRAVDWQGNVDLIGAASAAGVRHFVLISAFGARPDHPIELFRMKHRAEEAVRASALTWTILRPSAYAELWLDMLGRPLVEHGRTRVFGRGRNPINFVSVEDVAAFVALAIADPALRGAVVELPGPDNLGFDALLEPVREIAGGGEVSHVPPAMLRVMALAMRLVNPVLAAQIRSAIVLDTADMTADAALRAGYPVPLTSPADVARRLFASTDAQTSSGVAVGSSGVSVAPSSSARIR